MSLPNDHRAARENASAQVRVDYCGQHYSQRTSEPIGLCRLSGSDTELGRSLPYFELSIDALRLMHQTIGQFLGVKDAAAQVVEVRIVHESAPIAAAVGEQPRDSERGELDAIKTEMRRPAK